VQAVERRLLLLEIHWRKKKSLFLVLSPLSFKHSSEEDYVHADSGRKGLDILQEH